MRNRTIVLGVGGIPRPDAATVDVLARLQLTARRLGYSIELRDVPVELRDLLELVGLAEVVPICADLFPGVRGQAEQREQSGGVEEEGHPGDPIA
jgi:anti-anti-sigma regulatory factor